jgi:hypothetical protein
MSIQWKRPEGYYMFNTFLQGKVYQGKEEEELETTTKL